MAAAPSKTDKPPSAMALVIVVLLLTLVAAGAGLAAGSLLQTPASVAANNATETANGSAARDPTDAEQGHGTAEAKGEAHAAPGVPGEDVTEEQVELKPFPFPPILTMLAAPEKTWIRIEGSMLIAATAEEKPELLVERTATSILAYLRTVSLAQIEGPSGLLYFRQDINDLVSDMSGGQVREVLIHGLVVE